MRTQFPLRRAYAMTYHKSQGQTWKRVLLDLRNPMFTHGQTYVGFSRVTNYKDMAVIVNRDTQYFNATYRDKTKAIDETCINPWENDGKPHICNIVYQEVFEK